MQYGLGHLSIVPVRISPDSKTEMTTQLLYGDYFKVLEQRKKWSKIRIAFDHEEGWIENNQFVFLDEEQYKICHKNKTTEHSSELISCVRTNSSVLIPIVLASSVSHSHLLEHVHEGAVNSETKDRNGLANTATLYLHTPYLWGGKTPFGIDCSGLTQMVYKINGHKLLRNAKQQATQGEALSFIEESLPGDLAFFDNKDGVIDHVGIILPDNHLIHCHGYVRIDRIDHTGIFNNELRTYTHKLRVIKKIIA